MVGERTTPQQSTDALNKFKCNHKMCKYEGHKFTGF